jgi:hypothetical protein
VVSEEPRTRYFIDIGWYEQTGRSFRAVAQARFCAACKNKLGTETQERAPAIDPRTGRVVFEMRSVAFGINPLQAIRSCCAKARDYITPETPLAEAIFRVFLANGNQPTDIDSIREQLSEWVPLSARPHNYSPEMIKRVIDTDDYYGLREFKLAPP